MVEMLKDGQCSDRKADTRDSLWWDVVFVIIGKTPKITTNRRQIIWLRGMRYTIIVIEKNALLCEL
jgi:hypothetical protein